MDQQLQEVIRGCRQAYDQYEFHQVYQIINRFCTVQLSAFYVDVLKDRMYCDAHDSVARLSAQTVMHEILGALLKLLAPILPFTTEEAWSALGHQDSIYTRLFPEIKKPQPDSQTGVAWEELLTLRDAVNEQLEQARQRKEIGKSLEAELILPQGQWQEGDRTFLEEIFIVSRVHLAPVESIQVKRSQNPKCIRCWKYVEDLGTDPEHPELCPRCTTAVRSHLAASAIA